MPINESLKLKLADANDLMNDLKIYQGKLPNMSQ